jgi:hypothetical protein
MNGNYILNDDGTVRVEPDLHTWAQWFETANRHIGDDYLLGDADHEDVRVSTVFLGIDHNFHLAGEPVLFETKIFGGEHDQWQYRYSTKEQAVAGHAKALAWVKGEGTEP